MSPTTLHSVPRAKPTTTNGKTSPNERDSTNGRDSAQKSPSRNSINAGNNWQILWLPVDRIDPNPFQPRLSFDELEMQELIASVRAKGVQQPILVRTSKADKAVLDKTVLNKLEANGNSGDAKASNGKVPSAPVNARLLRYELVAGERRVRACKQAGKRLIPAIVRDDLSDAEAAELAILENVQRSNISVIEEARGYKRLMLEFRLKEERLAKKVGKSVGTIREMMKLLQLPEAVQTLLFEKKLTAAHGHSLLPLSPFEKVCVAVAEHTTREKLTATSLEATLLPNAKGLQKTGQVVELNYKTRFDWQSTCGQCPFKAYVRSGYSSYCLLPDEWEKKQLTALQQDEQQAHEAARIMEQARKDNDNMVQVDQLPSGSYKDLSFAEPPASCSQACPCFRETSDPNDPTKKRPICLDPHRYRELVQAQRSAEENARHIHFNNLWEAAKAKLLADVEKGDLRRLTVLLTTPILRSMYDENGYVASWRQGVANIAAELELPALEEFISAEDEADAYAALNQAMQDGLQADKVLLLSACLMLADEARTAIRFIRETPGLDFVLENKQQSLEQNTARADDVTDNSMDDVTKNATDDVATDAADHHTGSEPVTREAS